MKFREKVQTAYKKICVTSHERWITAWRWLSELLISSNQEASVCLTTFSERKTVSMLPRSSISVFKLNLSLSLETQLAVGDAAHFPRLKDVRVTPHAKDLKRIREVHPEIGCHSGCDA